MSLVNWAITKEIIENSKRSSFFPAEKLNLAAQFVDYNIEPTRNLRAPKTDLHSAEDWELKGATFLVKERRTRCRMGQDLQDIPTIQRPAPKELSRFDVLRCEQSEGWINFVLTQFKVFFEEKEFYKNTL